MTKTCPAFQTKTFSSRGQRCWVLIGLSDWSRVTVPFDNIIVFKSIPTNPTFIISTGSSLSQSINVLRHGAPQLKGTVKRGLGKRLSYITPLFLNLD